MYQVYRQLAAELGLRLSGDPGMMTFAFHLFGELEGQPVTLRRLCGSGARVDITSPLRPHLDLGLGITRAGVVSRVSGWLGKQDIQVGDPAVDAAFTIRGDEPERVTALLSPEVRAALSSIEVPDFELTDAEYSAGHRVTMGGNETFATLSNELQEAARIARMLGEARVALPPAAALRAHHEVWMAYAREHRLQAGPTPLWMQGTLGKTWVFARASRTGANAFSLQLVVRLENPLPIALGVEPKQGVIESLLGKPVSSTGDASFDSVFSLMRTEHEELVDEELRRRLLELSRVGFVSLRGSEVQVHTQATLDPSRVPLVLEELRSVLARLEENLKGPRAAYR